MLSRSISIVSTAVASSVLSLPQQKLKCEKNQQKAKIYKSSEILNESSYKQCNNLFIK